MSVGLLCLRVPDPYSNPCGAVGGHRATLLPTTSPDSLGAFQLVPSRRDVVFNKP